MTLILTSSINFIGHLTSHHCPFAGKKKAPKGAFHALATLSLRHYVDPFSLLVEAVKLDNTVNLREQRKVPAHSDILAWVDTSAKLANNDVSSPHRFAAKNFHSPSLALAVTSVTGTSPSLFMCHRKTPCSYASIAVIFSVV
jgi:hypothetical protein